MASVLIMEDNADQAFLLKDWLELEGHEAQVTHSAQEAIGSLNGVESFDLVLTDVFVSRPPSARGGLALIGHIRTSRNRSIKKMPIISVSGVSLGHSRNDISDQCLRLGSDAHFAKPVDLTGLGVKIAELLETRKANSSF